MLWNHSTVPKPTDGLRTPGFHLGRFRRHTIGVPQLAEVLRAVPPVNVARQDDLARALAVHLRVVDSRRRHALLSQSPRRVNPTPPRADDHAVGRSQVLLVSLVNRAHRLRHGHVLLANARYAAVAGECSLLLTV